MPEFAAVDAWKPQPVVCNIDLLEAIELEMSKADWSIHKIAYLKELGRAAFENPLDGDAMFKTFDDRTIAQAEAAAKGVAHPYEIKRCPAVDGSMIPSRSDG